MYEFNEQDLRDYLRVIDEVVQTSRRASEDFNACPDLDILRRGESAARDEISSMYKSMNWVAEMPTPGNLAELRSMYWNLIRRARSVSVMFGAANHNSLDPYFSVDAARTPGAIADHVRATHPPASIPVLILSTIEAYSQELRIPVSLAARIAVMHLNKALPALASHAQRHREDHGRTVRESSTSAMALFANRLVPSHIDSIRHLAGDAKQVSGQMSKRTFFHTPPLDTDPRSLVMTYTDARGLMDVYPLQKMVYTPDELRMGHRIANNDTFQTAFILFHLAIIGHTAEMLERQPDMLRDLRMLLPMTELFVFARGPQRLASRLSPNPKLVQVVCNNVVPAIASELARAGEDVDALSGDHIRRGVASSVSHRVFQLQIGKFNNFDPATSTVELSSMFPRNCPAMPMLSRSLAEWLPRMFEAVKSVT